MPEVLQPSPFETAQKNFLAYLETHDLQYVAEDAVFRNLSTGEVYSGKAEIGGMLHFIYHVAFDADFEKTNFLVTEDKAFAEGYFKGRQIGEIQGLPASNKEVDVPICVTYQLNKEGLIREARIYFLSDVLMKQLGVSATGTRNNLPGKRYLPVEIWAFQTSKSIAAGSNGPEPASGKIQRKGFLRFYRGCIPVNI